MKKIIAALVLAGMSTNQIYAASFGLGNLVVVQAGDGSAVLGSGSTLAFLKEFSTGGSLVQTINMPATASGLNRAFTVSGSATSEGFISLSGNGQYLTVGGYGVGPGTAAVAGTTASTVNRVVARVDMGGNVDTTTALSDAYSGSNIRSATSTDGINIWTGGNGGSGLGATAGPRYTTYGSSTSIRVDSTASNARVVNIFNGQLYESSFTGTLLGVSTVASGLPTTLAAGPITGLPGMPTTGTHSAYDFWFRDANTLYVADDGSAANGGGIQKWLLSSGTWSLAYTLLNNGTITTATRGLAGTLDGNGDAVLFGISGSSLFTVTDTGASALALTLATAPANTAFRGVEFIPAPEPTTAALSGLGILAVIFARRRN